MSYHLPHKTVPTNAGWFTERVWVAEWQARNIHRGLQYRRSSADSYGSVDNSRRLRSPSSGIAPSGDTNCKWGFGPLPFDLAALSCDEEAIKWKGRFSLLGIVTLA